MPTTKPAPAGNAKPSGGTGSVAWFRHWRTGEIITSKQHCKRGFPIGVKPTPKPQKG